ncbi:MAG: 5-carboxymethyl-2-hydroxymuconate isomerase, partial [Alphaproteobacteria bacterium]
MRLVTFVKDGRATCGVMRDGDEGIVDLSLAAPDLPPDWPAIFATDRALAAVRAA